MTKRPPLHLDENGLPVRDINGLPLRDGDIMQRYKKHGGFFYDKLYIVGRCKIYPKSKIIGSMCNEKDVKRLSKRLRASNLASKRNK